MELLNQLQNRIVDIGPRVLAVMAIALLGLLSAAVARRVVRWLVQKSKLETLAEKAELAPVFYAIGFRSGIAEVFASITWLLGLLLTLTAITDYLGLNTVSSLSQLAIRYTPQLVVAMAVLLGGLWAARTLRSLLSHVAKRRTDLEAPEVGPQIVYYAVVVTSVVLAADQAGFETGIVRDLVRIVATVLTLAVAAVFVVGVFRPVQQMAARHFVSRSIHPGDLVRVGRVQGILVRFTPVSAILRTEDGEVMIPCNQLMRRTVHLVALEDDVSPPAGETDHTSAS